MKLPSDLTDQEAMRLFLETLSTGTAQSNNIDYSSVGNIPIATRRFLDSPIIAEIIKESVRQFNKEFRNTIDTFNYNFEQIYGESLQNKLQTLYKIDGINSDINTVKTDLISANTKIDTNSSNLANNYSTTAVVNSTFATKTEVGALYSVNVDANGHVAGFQAVATGTTSAFNIYAEKFAVSSSATLEGYSPFQIDTVNHKINLTSNVAIDGSLLVSNSVTANEIDTTNLVVTSGVNINTGSVVINSSAVGTTSDPHISGGYIKGGTLDTAAIKTGSHILGDSGEIAKAIGMGSANLLPATYMNGGTYTQSTGNLLQRTTNVFGTNAAGLDDDTRVSKYNNQVLVHATINLDGTTDLATNPSTGLLVSLVVFDSAGTQLSSSTVVSESFTLSTTTVVSRTIFNRIYVSIPMGGTVGCTATISDFIGNVNVGFVSTIVNNI